MEGKKTISLKRDMYNMENQHNKLTTLVVVLLGEIEKLKADVKKLKLSSHENKYQLGDDDSTNEDDDQDQDQDQSQEAEKNAEARADAILEQLNLKTKNI